MEREEIRRLPDGELEVMQIIWDGSSPMLRADVEARMAERRPMAQTTLLTFISRLAEKGFLRVEKEGRRSVYTPLVTRQDYLSAQSRRFLDKLCGGSVPAFASALCDGSLSREELAELRRLLEEDAL